MKTIIFLLLLSQSVLADGTIAAWMFEKDAYEIQTIPEEAYGMDIPEYDKQELIIWDSGKQANCYISGGIEYCD